MLAAEAEGLQDDLGEWECWKGAPTHSGMRYDSMAFEIVASAILLEFRLRKINKPQRNSGRTGPKTWKQNINMVI